MAAASVDPNSASQDVPRRPRAHPSRRSLRGLDWFIFCLADVQVGFGAFVALYLTTQKWTQIDIGMVLSVAGLTALAGQIPGGALDPKEPHESAARRELREETGYTADRWTYLGYVEPNPAFQDNRCHHWLATGAKKTHELELDSGEDITVLEVPLAEVREKIASGEIRHSLVLTALARILDLRDEAGNPEALAR